MANTNSDIDSALGLVDAPQDPVLTVLESHFAAAGISPKDALEKAGCETRLSDDVRQAATEAMPIGFVLKRTGPNNWSAHVEGQPQRFANAGSAVGAIEAFLLGERTHSAVKSAARAFAKLPATQREEIIARDEAAAKGPVIGGTEGLEAARAEAVAEFDGLTESLDEKLDEKLGDEPAVDSEPATVVSGEGGSTPSGSPEGAE